MNALQWVEALPRLRKPLPILSFPSTQLLGVSVRQLTHDAQLQAEGIARIASRVDVAAAVTTMDLSVEAEAFGCVIRDFEEEVPTVVGALITEEEEAEALEVPSVGAGRTGLYVEAARLAKERVTDRPVLAGMIGPFSLAGRMMDVSEALANCIAEPDLVHALVGKATDFLVEYAKAYRAAGLDGLMMAEPLAGLLSPALEAEFSAPYVKRIVEAVQCESFAVIYHNCGPNTPHMLESIAGNGSAAYHFGDAVSLAEILKAWPSEKPVCGNVSPSAQFLNGTPESMRAATRGVLEACSADRRFVLSSGCDIPPKSAWANIDAFFEEARAFYASRGDEE